MSLVQMAKGTKDDDSQEREYCQVSVFNRQILTRGYVVVDFSDQDVDKPPPPPVSAAES
jgi:hypothetical protein